MAPGMAHGMPHAPLPLPPKKNTGRTCLSAFLGVVGGLALLGGGALTAHTFSNAAQDVPNRSGYGPTMWRNLPAEKLFPKTLGPKMNSQAGATDPKHAEWHRVGISQKTGCADSLTGATLAEAKKKGCKAVLRATYVDPTGNVLGTVGLIVLPETDSAEEGMATFFDAEKEKRNPKPGVKAMGVPRTIAAGWKDGNRNGSEGLQATSLDMSYAYVATTGSVDGRKAGHLPGEWGETSLDAKSDRGPWREAAASLANDLNLYHGDLLLEETS
ncbi:hypothetical protein OG533_32930 [Streptomyces sp. NBC_01186]|uniref:hypothetical protein n=1 Tax=Streptomyces sp. NBC_01186 TaxID=2903765 RepID=UPI002E0FB528|nr:hypothetical protein OG533_32930 [Streptomyces sp. NBC_01186]